MNKNWKLFAFGVTVVAILTLTACSADNETEELSFAEEETSTQSLSLVEDETQETETEKPSFAGEETHTQENSAQTVEHKNSETKENETIDERESVMDQQESNMQEAEDAGLEATADELLDSFINGSINAVDSTDLTSTFYITDLNMDSEEWDSYSIGEKVDLDNDGENELVISGPYGGIYLDARDNKVYEFAKGDGNAK